MINEKNLDEINAEIKLLEIQKEIIESEKWDDKTHLERAYPMHLNTFDSAIRYLCNSLGVHRIGEINKNGVFKVETQNGEKSNFDISKDFNGERGQDKLICYLEFNNKTKAHALLHYSPTKGTAFEYGANILPKNVQLGKGDFFGKTIEKIIKNVASATEGVKFNTNVERFENAPNGLKYFYISTKDFVKDEEKQGDVISIISTLDSLIRGVGNGIPWVYGSNFIHEKDSPLFTVKFLGVTVAAI